MPVVRSLLARGVAAVAAVGPSVFALSVVIAGIFASASHAQAQDVPQALTVSAETVVIVDPDADTVSGTHNYQFYNETMDGVFDGFFETLPLTVADVTAWAGPIELAVSRGSSTDDRVQVFVTFPGSLDPGDELAVELSWTRSGLDGDPDDLDQVSPALVAIEVFAVGSSGGEAELTVEVPTGFEVVESSELIVGEVEGRVVFHSSVAEAYVDHVIVLSASDRLFRATVPDVELDITVASLPGFDPSLVSVLGDVVSILTEWLPVEIPGPIEFRHGWTGDDDVRLIVGGAASETAESEAADTLVVVVSPSTEVSVVARELAAAWLAPIPFESSQLEEAFARVFGDAAARELGAEPAAHSVENPWVAVLAPAFAELDSSATAGVIEVLANGWLSYPGLSPLQHDHLLDWRVVLDALENAGGTLSAADRFRSITDAGEELDRRDEARLAYFELVSLADEWVLPPWLRVPMAEWDFERFDERRRDVPEFLAARDELIAAATDIELEVGPFVRDLFESTDGGLGAATELLTVQSETLVVVAEARQLVIGDRGLLARIGLMGLDPEADYDHVMMAWTEGDFATATEEAHELIEEIDGAMAEGTLRIVIPAVIVLALAWLARVLFRFRFSGRKESTVESPEDPDEAGVQERAE